MIMREIELQRPFDKDIRARAPTDEYRRLCLDADYISPARFRAHFSSASSAAKQADRRRLLSAVQDHRQLEQARPELLKPPSGKHFDSFDGLFDVVRWFGQHVGPSSAAAPRTLFGSASLGDLCAELARCKPVEQLHMASPWFPLNSTAIGYIVEAALVLNAKNLKRVTVSCEEDKKVVERLLAREQGLRNRVEVSVAM